MKKYSLILIFGLVCSLVLNSCATIPKVPKAKKHAEELFEQLEKEERKEKRTYEEEQKELEQELEKTQKEEIISEPAKEEKKTKIPYPKEVIPFEEVGIGITSKYEKPIDAEKRAEEDALNRVMKKAGVDVYYGFSDTLAQYGNSSYQFVARYLMSWSKGIVSYEVENKKFTTTQTEGIECTLKIKGKIHYRGEPDPGYEIHIDTPDRKLGLDKTIYHPGEKVKLNLRVTKDSYINILNIDEDNNVYLLYPNKFITSNLIKAGEVFEFPGDTEIDLKVVLPDGRKEAMELIHIIATKNAPLFTPEETIKTGVNEYFFEVGKSKDVISRLAKLKREEWTMMVIPYGIRSEE